MATERTAWLAVPAAAAMLLWPALWNGYPIVFADTGTYLSQAIHRYAGWDRPVFYSLFMLPFHATVTVWPVVVAQGLLTAWVLWLVCRVLRPDMTGLAFVSGTAVLAAATWLPWIVSELMPDLFTPLLILMLCLLVLAPHRLSPREQIACVGLAAFMIASQQSSVPLACVLLGVLALFARCVSAPIRWKLLILPPALAILALCSANLLAHGRFAVSPFGDVFLLARVIYDGPGMATLRRDCPAAGWRLCPFVDDFPKTSDDFLWTPDSPAVPRWRPATRVAGRRRNHPCRAGRPPDRRGTRHTVEHGSATGDVRQRRRAEPVAGGGLPLDRARFPQQGSCRVQPCLATSRITRGSPGPRVSARGGRPGRRLGLRHAATRRPGAALTLRRISAGRPCRTAPKRRHHRGHVGPPRPIPEPHHVAATVCGDVVVARHLPARLPRC